MSSKFALTAALSLLLALILACGGAAPAEQVVVEKEIVTEREGNCSELRGWIS